MVMKAYYRQGKRLEEKNMELVFCISKGILKIMNAPSGSYDIKATSGKGEYMNNPGSINIPDLGPIPVGSYFLYPNEFSDPDILTDLWRNIRHRSDWGDWLIKLHPSNNTNTFGRKGFHLHCGSFDGTAGCIDIGGGILGNTNTERIKSDILESNQENIKLNVVR